MSWRCLEMSCNVINCYNSLVAHIVSCAGFQIAVYFYTVSEPWFCSITDNSPSCFNRTADGAILNVLPNPKCSYQTCDEYGNIFQPINTNMSRCDEYEFGDDELYEHYVTQALFLFTSFQFGIDEICNRD